MKSIALLPHTGKEEAIALAKQLLSVLEARGASVWIDPEAAPMLGRPGAPVSDADLSRCQMALVLGGDGALLKAARLVAPLGVPILGVNLGHLGFLTEVEPHEVTEAIDRLFKGDYKIEERLMLRAEVLREGNVAASFFGLNDAVVTRGVFARVIELHTFIDEHPIAKFLGDGVIVSTPTGSTAYNLSAGGPIVNPNVEGIIITPICPHTVGTRTLIACADQVVTVRLAAKADDAMLTVDGQEGEALQPGDEVVVRRASKPMRLVKLKGRSFYTVLHDRFLRASGRL